MSDLKKQHADRYSAGEKEKSRLQENVFSVNALEERIHGRKRGKLTSRPVKKEKPWMELGALCVMLLWCFVLARERTEHGFPS